MLILCCHSVQVFSQDSLSRHILFVGNSYTYFWNLPQSVQAMAASQNLPYVMRQSTSGGTNLGQHWRGEKSLQTVSNMESGAYDAIILQDHSLQAINHPDSLLIYATKLAALVSDNDTRVLLYMTWAREWNPYMLNIIQAEYIRAADAIDAELIPVGIAWQQARTLRHDLKLFHPDGSHPSPAGTYLTACVVYAVLTGMSPVGLPPRLTSTDIYGEPLYLNIQTEEDAEFLQQVAWDVVQGHHD